MYKLYWHPNTCSLAPMAILEEIGVPYDSHELNYEGGEHRRPHYLRIHPLGLIPALGLENGESMFESAAIVQFLCDRHMCLAPSIEQPERCRFLQWLYFMSNTLYPSYNRISWPERYTATPKGAAKVKSQARHTVLKQWQVIENALSRNGPWLLGHSFSACDIYLQMVTTWHEDPADLLDTFPHIRSLARGVIAREACSRAVQQHKAKTGFGFEAETRNSA